MPALRLFRVTSKVDIAGRKAGAHIAGGIHLQDAALRWLRYECGIVKAQNRAEVLAAGHLDVKFVEAFRIFLLDPSKPREEYFLHAPTRKAARAEGAAALGCAGGPDVFAERTDSLRVLLAAPAAEVISLCRMCWGNSDGRMTRIETLVPSVAGRINDERRRNRPLGKVSPGTKALGAYALACAMRLDWLGPSAEMTPGKARTAKDRGYLVEGNRRRLEEDPAYAAGRLGRREYRVHTGFVPDHAIERCIAAGLSASGVMPYTEIQREALACLARAYGFDPEKLSWHQMEDLWKRGQEA